MDATISVVCYKSKMLSNGEYPLMVRVAKDGKRSMKSLGVSVNPIYWDLLVVFEEVVLGYLKGHFIT